MKREPFLAALKTAAPALGDDSAALPALSHFCFEDDSFYAWNDVTAVVVGLKTGLTLGLHGPTLLGVLAASRAEDIEFKQKGSVMSIVGGGRVELPILGKEDFQFQIPAEEPILSVPLSADIKHALEVCLISVAEDSLRPEYNGVTLRIGKSGTVLLSSDNNTATRMEPKAAKVPARKDAALVLPKQAADLIMKLFSSSEGAPVPKIHIGERIAVIEFGGDPDITLVTKLLGTPSGKLEEVFKAHANENSCVLPTGLEAEIEKARVLSARESLKECTLTAEKGNLVISVSASLGKMKSTLGLDDKKIAGQVTIDPDLLARVLPFCSLLAINDGRSLVLQAEGLTHIVSAVPKAQPAPQPAPALPPAPKRREDFDPDDIPF